MSFILDALKKSENDRQRQSGPALFEVRVAPPRSKLPMLAIVIVSLLVVNLGVVGWIMLRKPAAAAVPAAATPAAATPAQVNAQPSAAAQPQPYAQNPPPQGYTQYGQPNMQGGPNGVPAQGYNQAAPNNGYPPNGYTQQGNPQNGYPPPNTSYAPNAPNAEPSLADQAPAQQEQYNPDDYAPARDTPPPGTGAGRVTRGTESGLPTYEEAALQASIPPLHMDLHSYAADPTKRFVLINMRRLYEGQSLPEGPKVESINTDSAIISYNGKRFVMNKD
jgi:general secretion pathway protein B